MMKKVFHKAAEIIELMTVACFVILGIITVYRIIGRWVGINALAWTDEMITIFTTWMVFLGYAYLCEYDIHVTVTVLHDYVSPKMQEILNVIVRIANIVCGIGIGYSAFVWTRQNTTKITSYLALHYNVWQDALWICSIVFVLFALLKFVEQIQALVSKK